MRAFFLLFLCGLASLHAAAPVVSNISAAQRPNSRLVDITYDVAADFPTVSVSLQVSSDGGDTFAVPATTLSGAIGAKVTTGKARKITWDAGKDWSGQYSPYTYFRLIVMSGYFSPMEFALIPRGKFLMGDSLDGDNEAPIRIVSTDEFYMGKYEVTKAEWDEVRTWALSNGYSINHPGSGDASNHPVHSIGWDNMLLWCNARSEKEGLTPVYYTDDAMTTIYKTNEYVFKSVQVKWSANGYRLPTEAEWEKAARGGLTGKRFPWGDTISHSQAHYYAFSGIIYDLSGSVNDNQANGTLPVGSFAPNGYGLYDVVGNVWEQCWDWYGDYYYITKSSPTGPVSGTLRGRVARGGNFTSLATGCRVANRDNINPDYYGGRTGFRVALSPTRGWSDSPITVDTRLSLITSNLGEQRLSLSKLMKKYGVTNNFDASTFSATGLPPGLSINKNTGVISGTPTKKGTYTVTITAQKRQGTTVTKSATAKKVFKVV